MAIGFDPTLPVDNSLIVAEELRNQFSALNYEATTRAFKPAGVADLSGLTISNPPTQAEVTALRDKINELLTALNA